MSVNPANATQAYLEALRNSKGGGVEPRREAGGDFADMLGKLVESTAGKARWCWRPVKLIGQLTPGGS